MNIIKMPPHPCIIPALFLFRPGCLLLFSKLFWYNVNLQAHWLQSVQWLLLALALRQMLVQVPAKYLLYY